MGAGVVGFVMSASVVSVTIHEFARQGYIASYEPEKALFIDLAWVIGGVLTYIPISAIVGMNGGAVVFAWSAGAALTAAFYLWTSRSWQPRAQVPRLDSRSMKQFGFEFIVSRSTPEMVGWALALFGGIASAGHFRLAQVLLGPLSVVVGGARAVLISEMRPHAEESSVLKSLAVRSSMILAAIPLVYLAAIWLLRSSLVALILGDVEEIVVLYALFLAARRALVAISVPPFLVLRVKDRLKQTSLIRLSEAVIALASIGVAAFLAGANGALWGYAFASLITAFVWWSSASQVLQHHVPCQKVRSA